MSNSHEVISALLDERAFDLPELAATLEQPEGRALLIDLLALRRIVQPAGAMPLAPPVKPMARSWLRPAVAAAAIFAALTGGYFAGMTRGPTVSSEAPAPTRVVQTTVTTWQEMPIGGQR
jgi:hypothetical protein